MLQITVRKAQDNEKLNISEEAETLPKGVRSFDSTDWWAHFLTGIQEGDWVVTISDPDDMLNWQQPGIFFLQKEDDAGFALEVHEGLS